MSRHGTPIATTSTAAVDTAGENITQVWGGTFTPGGHMDMTDVCPISQPAPSAPVSLPVLEHDNFGDIRAYAGSPLHRSALERA